MGYAIKTATRTIVELKADIEDGEATVSSKSEEVTAIGTEIAAKDKQLGATKAERETEKAEFDKAEKELIESIDELEGAVAVIKKDVSFVQQAKTVHATQKNNVKAVMKVIAKILSANWVNQKTFKALKGFVQTNLDAGEGEDLKLKSQPEVKAYESQSGGILGQPE